MSDPLSPAETQRYTRIIDGILETADLATVTRKKIRAGLETAIGRDLSNQKSAIKALIEARFDVASSAANNAIPTPEVEPHPSPSKRSAADYEDDDDTPAPAPARKKQKRESSIEDQDARLAAQLQAEENSLSRVRKTRGGGTAKPVKKPVKKRQPKKKSRATVDDSDVEASESKPKRNTGFQKPFLLSQPLVDLVGEEKLSRPQVVKKIWDYIKANNLQDPADKRHINCDEKMQAVFKTQRVHMFSMNKHLGSQLYPVEDGGAEPQPKAEPNADFDVGVYAEAGGEEEE